jgi:hypothetical protein
MKISRWLLLGVSHRYWNFTVVITNCQQFPNIHLTNGNASFFFYVDFVFPLSPTRLSPGFTISNMTGAIEKQELLNLREHMWCPCCSYSYFSVLCVLSFFWSFCVLYPVLPMFMNCPVLFVIVLCLVSSVAFVYELSSLVCDRSVPCTQCCQCLWIDQSCLWPLCIVCPVLSVSMDCPVLFVIVLCLVTSVVNVYGLSSLVCNRSVYCAQCCQCLWIVQSCL